VAANGRQGEALAIDLIVRINIAKDDLLFVAE